MEEDEWGPRVMGWIGHPSFPPPYTDVGVAVPLAAGVQSSVALKAGHLLVSVVFLSRLVKGSSFMP